ncbi:MAG: ABC transporter ATP-binding protein [Clostridiales bacterium]|jgi:ABC-2 type transport system ATP-binding protein|nr:ABC transporter ATP-binding protein [Clostridiales bacterium]
MIEISGLTKTYANGAVKAVDNLSLKVEAGEIFGFLGPNGAGKSTTIKSMIGVLPFEAGTVKIFGCDLKKNPLEAKKFIGFVPDNNVIYDKLTGIEYLNFMSAVYGVDNATRKERIEKYGALFNLSDDLSRQIKNYSHGMRQKICIMGAIIHKPKLWILDEPMTGLDPQSAFDLKKLMREYCESGSTVFFSSHVLDVAEKLCDRVAIINKGRLVVDTTMAELKEKQSDKSLEQYFLSVTGGSV